MSAPTITDPAQAARLLAEGGLVALPTETVYGLAADAGNPVAVSRIFEVKGRPRNHPLIVHLSSTRELDAWVQDVPTEIRDLVATAWPGPLTVVLARRSDVPDAITGGQDTVALRVPDSAQAREAIAELARITGRRAGVVAPSANPFGGVSPTTAQHVAAGLGDRLVDGDAILDGGQCRVGVESTIVTATAQGLKVLRPGGYPIRTLSPQPEPGRAESELQGPEFSEMPEALPRVPGSLERHYSPRARVVLSDEGFDVASRIGVRPSGTGPDGAGTDLGNAAAGTSMTSVPHVGLLAPRAVPTPSGWHRLAAPVSDEQYAHELYAALRRADELGLSVVVVVPPQPGPLAEAINDRLRRAAQSP